MKVRAITISVPPNASGEQEKTAREKIDQAAAEVKGGKDFAEVAKARSEDQATKATGGGLGFAPRGAAPRGKTYEDQAHQLKHGPNHDAVKGPQNGRPEGPGREQR